jgi:hypothetical protein
MKRKDIDSKVKQFKTKFTAEHRYASLDYCFNYFKTTKNLDKDIEKSCLTLGFYLASWGMFRGSSFLLQKSAKHFKPTIHYITSLDKSVWKIDVDTYNEKNIKTIIDIYKGIKKSLIPMGIADITLTTKIMLGVFGFVPAFDNFFCDTFRIIYKGKCGFRKVNHKSLNLIHDFYYANKNTVDKLSAQTHTIDFKTGKKTRLKYPKAKIIDMYGFTARL